MKLTPHPRDIKTRKLLRNTQGVPWPCRRLHFWSQPAHPLLYFFAPVTRFSTPRVSRQICVYNLGQWSNGPAPQTMTDSPLRYQTRCGAVQCQQELCCRSCTRYCVLYAPANGGGRKVAVSLCRRPRVALLLCSCRAPCCTANTRAARRISGGNPLRRSVFSAPTAVQSTSRDRCKPERFCFRHPRHTGVWRHGWVLPAASLFEGDYKYCSCCWIGCKAIKPAVQVTTG